MRGGTSKHSPPYFNVAFGWVPGIMDSFAGGPTTTSKYRDKTGDKSYFNIIDNWKKDDITNECERKDETYSN
jgi:hypothetical protein